MNWNAKSLQRVVKELERYGSESSTADPLLFQGSGLAGPILLSLATEIALKAWQCRERKNAPDRTHDLLDLFMGLEPDTQELLQARMPGWPEILEGTPFRIRVVARAVVVSSGFPYRLEVPPRKALGRVSNQ